MTAGLPGDPATSDELVNAARAAYWAAHQEGDGTEGRAWAAVLSAVRPPIQAEVMAVASRVAKEQMLALTDDLTALAGRTVDKATQETAERVEVWARADERRKIAAAIYGATASNPPMSRWLESRGLNATCPVGHAVAEIAAAVECGDL